MVAFPFRKKIPPGSTLPVRFSHAEVDLITKKTFMDSGLLSVGVVEKTKIRFDLSLDVIEEILGYVAAEANHTESASLQKKLDRVGDYLQSFLDSYDDRDE